MDKKEYEEDCERCDISQRSILLPGGIIELQGDWILTQYNEKESFQGWMVLQPRCHRRELTDLTKDEGDLFVKNIQRVDTVLRQYWSIKFPDDPIERTYVTSFSEAEGLHLHFHLIPRTRGLGQGNPQEYVAWRIFELTDTWKEFPERYRIKDKRGKWSHAGVGKVEALMTHLRGYFWEYSGKDPNSGLP
jgi:diadenosine tetraphosphate (Ap4A) HIT family hydrolase